MSHLAFRRFGAPRPERDGAPVHITRRKALACAVYLAMTAQKVSRETLATLFWPEMDQTNARADLRRILHMLHHTLGAGYIVPNQEHVRFDRDANLYLTWITSAVC